LSQFRYNTNRSFNSTPTARKNEESKGLPLGIPNVSNGSTDQRNPLCGVMEGRFLNKRKCTAFRLELLPSAMKLVAFRISCLTQEHQCRRWIKVVTSFWKQAKRIKLQGSDLIFLFSQFSISFSKFLLIFFPDDIGGMSQSFHEKNCNLDSKNQSFSFCNRAHNKDYTSKMFRVHSSFEKHLSATLSVAIVSKNRWNPTVGRRFKKVTAFQSGLPCKQTFVLKVLDLPFFRVDYCSRFTFFRVDSFCRTYP
jgi:hypothetical protein